MAFKVRFNDDTVKTFATLSERNAYESDHGVYARTTTEVDDETPIRLARIEADTAKKKLRILVLEALVAGQPIFTPKSGSMKRNGGILGDSQLGAGEVLSWFQVTDSKNKPTGEYKTVLIPGTQKEVTLGEAQIKELLSRKREGRPEGPGKRAES